MTVSKISPTQQKVLDELGTERLTRLEGGFWVPESRVRQVPLNASESLQTWMRLTDTSLRDWWIDIRTIRAMERKGYLERCNDYPEEWRDNRRLCQTQ